MPALDHSLLAARPEDLTSASAEFLIRRGFYGLVWLDPDLSVVARKGDLVEFVEIGLPVGIAVIQLYGLDPQILRLRQDPRRAIEFHNIALVGPDGSGPRLNFYLHWMEEAQRFLLIIARATSQYELETELESQSRRTALAEAELAAKAKELEVVNAELTEFAYVISHDLKSPMRGLRYQAEDLEAALANGDATVTGELLDGLKAQTRRMSQMLSDLLDYARIGRTPVAIQPTNTRNLIAAIVRSLPHPEGFQVEISGNWPELETVGPALDLVLRNLLDNAIKHHDRPDGRVVISGRPVEEGVAIEMRDDGPGIPRQHQAAVFLPFRKLKEDGLGAEGSGIGLALVRKTAGVMGASLVLESDPDVRRGTTFKLVWPGRPVQ